MTPLDALQTTLAAEHAAVYVYGVLGARTSPAAEPSLFAAARRLRRPPGTARPAGGRCSDARAGAGGRRAGVRAARGPQSRGPW